MKILLKIYRQILNLIRFIWNNLSNFIAILALIVAIISLNNANEQFHINSITSDSLFKVQLKNSNELNDSLIIQISKLQDITNKQLRITNEQLSISKQNFQDKIYSGKPYLIVTSIDITDLYDCSENKYCPDILITVENTGKRIAGNFNIRHFIIFDQFSQVQGSGLPLSSGFVDPGSKVDLNFLPKLNEKAQDDFYHCFETSYFDEIIDRYFTQVYYFHYYKSRGSFTSVYCSKEEEDKLRGMLNFSLREMGKKILGQ